MILGIIGLVLFLLGFSTTLYGLGNKNDDIIAITGIAMLILGFIILVSFIGINADTIVRWFKV